MVYILIIIALLIIWGVVSYNGFIRVKNQVSEAGSQIDVQLKRRNDLIPNLVETVKGYSKYESETLTKITSLRAGVSDALDKGDRNEAVKLSDQLTAGLHSLQVSIEAYPDLKASSNYSQLMEELTNTENKVANSRRLYNSVVADWNTRVETFPNLIIAGIAHFNKQSLLETPEDEKKVPTVKF